MTSKGKSRNRENISIAELKETPGKYSIYGRENIDREALRQMETAMRLPVAQGGALMPDAHSGYGLPIGGVLATDKNCIIPYAVGVDIACRMCMSVYNINPKELLENTYNFRKLLFENTVFGVGSECQNHFDETVFDKNEWTANKTLSDLKDKAWRQLGTSGAGNHFAEWGILEVIKKDNLLKLDPGRYTALLTHSGSRGFGEAIAQTYSKIAMQKNPLPAEAKHLAWLHLDSSEGQEYWLAMNLAGEYASANHKEIHSKITFSLGENPAKTVENHHNFAWKETLANGRQVIIHRKGATPAGIDNIGIIPGSMAQHGFIIRGKGNQDSLNSSSHGAGRLMSRNMAYKTIERRQMHDYLEKCGITLIGGDIDEAPMVYKDIDLVMENQKELVDVIARFSPKIVRMAEQERRKRRHK